MDRSTPPFFGALDALAIDDGGRRAGRAAGAFAQLDVERVMDAQQCPVPVPQLEIIVQRRLGWEVLRQRPPLAPGGQQIEDRVQHLAHIDRALAPAALGRRDQRRDQGPLLVRQIAGIAQAGAIVGAAILSRPHGTPP